MTCKLNHALLDLNLYVSRMFVYPYHGRGSIEIKWKDYKRLYSRCYLNDVVIDCFLKW